MSDKEKEILEEEATVTEEVSTQEPAEEAETKEAEATAEEEIPEKEESKEDKAKGFKKKDKKDKKTEALENANKELEDKVMRQMAEFQNYRNRTEKEKAAMFEMGAKSVVEKILPVVDNFERGLASVPEDQQTGSVYEGMNLIYKQLMSELDKLGVKPIEALGQEFNPDFHNAVMQVESEEFEEGIVAQELQKGYMYRESVVRHSMVAVAQ